MNENKTIVTTLDFKMVGEKELVGLFQNLNQLFDTEKLKTEANKVHATLLGVFKNIEKDLMSGTAIDINNTGVVKGLNQLSSLLDKIQVKAVGSSATKVLEEIDGKIVAAQARVDKAMESVKKIDKEIEAKKSELLKRMQDGSLGQVFTEDLQETDSIVSKLAQVRKEMEELNAEGKDITGLKKQEESLIRLAQAIQEVNKDLIKLGRSKGGHASQKTQGENALKDLTSQKKDAIAANPREINDQAKAYQRLYDILELFRTLNLDQAVRDERKEREKSNEETKKATEENEKLNRSIKKGEKTWGRKVLEMFAYQNVLRQIKQVWTTSIQVINDLDRAMVEAAIVTNMTTKETWKLLGSYQELADIVGRSTSEIASLNAFFLQQGLTVKNAMEMTEVAAKSAAIAGISLQESANYLTSAINGFGLAASAAEEVADKFAAVGAATAADFEELAIAMSKVAPVAQSAGVGIDFMMGVLAKGIHTTREAPENIGTAFKTIFARMSELTDMGKAMEDGMSLNRVEKALESVGISLRDQMGQFRDLEDVLYEVGFAWKDLDSLQQNYLATALAGTRQQPRLMAILNDFEETVDFINISKDSAQAMEFQHMEYMTGMEAASQSVRNAWEKVVTSFVNSEVVISLLKTVSSLVNGLSKAIDLLNNGFVKWIAIIGIAVIANKFLNKEILKSILLAAKKKWALIQLNITTLASTVSTIGLGAAFKLLGSMINQALGPIGWIIIGLTAVVAIGKALYNVFKDTTMSVEEANKAIYESEQRNKGLDSTISRFEELQKKVNKTNEELEEMIELQNQLESFDGADGEQINFLTEDQYGNKTVDQEKVRENRLEEETIQTNARKDIERNIKKENQALLYYNETLKNINSSIERMENKKAKGWLISESDLEGNKQALAYYEELASEEMKKMGEKFGKEFKKIGRKAGEDFGKGLLKDGRITQGQVDEYEKAVGRIMGSVNFSNFLTDNGKADTKLAAKMGAQIGNIVGKAFESANNSEKMNLGLEEGLSAQLKAGLSAQLKAYQDMIKELDALGLSPSEMNEIKVQLGFEFGNEQALEVLEAKNIDMSVVATFIDKGGKLEQLHQVLTSLGQMENEDVNNETWEEQEKRRKTAEDKIKKLDDSDAEQDQRIVDEEWKGKWITQKQVRAQRDTIKEQNAIEREKLQKELDEMLTQEQKALSKISDESIARLFSREDLEGSIGELRATLVEGGMDIISAGQYIESEITSKLGLKNAAQIADAGANIGNTMSKALKIGEEMAAGDFTGYLELAQEFSQDAVDAFLETGDISGLVDKATENMIKDINDQRAALKGDLLSEEEILAEIEKMRADGKSQPEIDQYLESTKNINKNINEQLKALDIMEGSMDAINFKMSVYESFTKSAADNFSKANGFLKDMETLIEAGFDENSPMVGLLKGLEEQYRDQALADSFNNLANIQEELERDKAELIEKGFMDVDGNMILKEGGKELQESYKKLVEAAADAAQNVTGEVLRKIEINNKEYAEKIKESNETYKNLIDSMNKMHKARWDDVTYENKLIDLQKNIYDARNKLASSQIGGTQKQMQDAQEELRRMQQERRKAIEEESIKRLEEDLEKQRKEAEDKLEAKKMEQNELLIKNIGDLNTTMEKNNELVDKSNKEEDKKTENKPKTTRPPSGGGGKGNQISLEKLMV